MTDIALLRNRLRKEIESARRDEAERRARAKHATAAFETFLHETAIPLLRQVANVVRAEGVLFDVQTPTGGVRLVSERNRQDVIELDLDSSIDPPAMILRTSRSRGGRSIQRERPVKERGAVDSVTEDDLLDALVEELRPWLA